MMSLLESAEMSEEQVPLFDSLSFALLIPFAICFVLIFLVCCFADQIKDICRMPSPLPASYLAAENSRPRRHSRHRRRQQSDEVRNLILSEEGRSRNVSESSSNDQTVPNISHGQYDHQVLPVLTNSMTPISEIPDTSLETEQNLVSSNSKQKCITLLPAPHSVLRSQNRDDVKVNFLRNLSLSSSALTLPSVSSNCANSNNGKLTNSLKTHTDNDVQLNTNSSAPQILSQYLSTVLPSTHSDNTTDDTERSNNSIETSAADGKQKYTKNNEM